jgi:hypothetical protein
MSLILSDASPTGLTIKTCGVKFEVGEGANKRREQVVMLGDCEIPMSEFCTAVEYVLSNTDLDLNDPRIGMVERIKKATVVPGHNAVAGINPNCLKYEMA